MSRVKVKDGKLDINRVLYKDIKRYDRETMQEFLQDIYETGVKNGYEKGLQGASKGFSEEQLNIKETSIIRNIGEIKGIGPAKLKEIDFILKAHLKELMADG